MNVLTQDPFAPPKPNKRPGLLTALCIISFVGQGWSFIYNVFIAVMAWIGFAAMASMSNSVTMLSDTSPLSDGSYYSFIIASIVCNGFVALLNIPMLVGTIKMFRLKRAGFIIYLVSQCLQVVVRLVPIALSVFLLDMVGFSIVSLLIPGIVTVASVVFIILYSNQLSVLR